MNRETLNYISMKSSVNHEKLVCLSVHINENGMVLVTDLFELNPERYGFDEYFADLQSRYCINDFPFVVGNAETGEIDNPGVPITVTLTKLWKDL